MKRILSLLALGLMALAATARAEDGAVSPWSQNSHASLRLIAGPTAASGKQRVGIEIVMAPGYKTYWRSPGDYGVPPAFDWSGSTNVGGLDVRWPAPERFKDANGHSIGYVGEVVIPISVQPVDPAKPVMLVLKLDFAVCDKICIPIKSETRLWLEPGVTTVTSPRLDSFEVRVPVPAKLGPRKEKLAILEAKPSETAVGEPALRLVLQAPPEGVVEDVFVEGAGMWSFGKPMFSQQPDGTTVALLRILEQPKGSAGPVPFIITARGRPGAIETRLELDIPVAKP